MPATIARSIGPSATRVQEPHGAKQDQRNPNRVTRAVAADPHGTSAYSVKSSVLVMDSRAPLVRARVLRPLPRSPCRGWPGPRRSSAA